MSTAPFEIKVVYDATRRKGRGAVVRTSHGRAARASGLLFAAGAILHLAVAGSMYYVTWQVADPFLTRTMLTKTPLTVPAKFAANPFGIGRSMPTDPDAAKGIAPEEAPSNETEPSQRWTGKTAQWLVPATAFGWLTLTAAASFAVALSAGTWLGLSTRGRLRILARIAALLLLVALGFAAWRLWVEYGFGFKVEHLRAGMAGVTLLFVLIGFTASGFVRGLTKFAAIAVILAAVGTAAGIWLWTQCGALDVQYAAWPKLAAAFGIHATWGLILLFSAGRIKA